MSRRDNLKRIFVGNLPPDVRTRDLEDLFYKFGKIAFIDLKTRRGPPFAFVEFHDYRDAEEAVRCRDGKEWDGCRLRVEFPRGRERPSRFKNGSGGSGAGGGGGGGGGARSTMTQRRSKFRVKVSGLPASGSWQDLKDHMRGIGDVCFADVFKGGEGVVEFVNYDDMRYAIRKLNNTKFKSHEGESSYIKLREDNPSGDSRSRSRSPIATKRRGSPSYSPVTKRRDVSHSLSRSHSRSPRPRRGGSGSSRDHHHHHHHHHKRPTKRAVSGSRSRSVTRSRSHSRSRSASGSRSRSASRSRSNSRSRTVTPARSEASSRGSRDRSPKSRSKSRSESRSPVQSDRGRESKSNSRSVSPADNKNRERSSSKE